MSSNKIEETQLDSPTNEKKIEIYENEYAQQVPSVGFDPLNVDTKGMTETQLMQVRSAAFAAAVAQDPLNPRSKASFLLYFCVFVTFLGSCANGYDGSLFSGISPMTQYRDHFKVETTGEDVSKIFSMYGVGSMIGALFAGPVSDKYGRRMGMFVGGFFIVVGMVIVSCANSIGQLVGGRFVLGFGIAIMTVGAPAYCVEIAPAQWRGRFVGLYNNGWNGGAIPAAIVCYACNNIQSNWAWRIPMIGQGSYSIAVMCLVWFLPESPRWLLANGRREEALAFLVKYHGNGNPNSALVKLEMQEMDEALAESTGSDKRWWDYRGLFMTKNSRYRMLSVLLISVFGQFSGNGLGYFQNVIYENLGYTDVKTQLALNLGGSFLGAVCGVTGALFADKMPRVKVLTIGTFFLSVFLAINGGLSELIAQQPKDADGKFINPNNKLGQGALAANYLFSVVYSFTYTPLQGVYPAENLTSSTRAKGLAASGIIVSLFGFINTYAGPIALKRMKNRYIFVFVVWDLIETAIWWFCGVETVGRTIEELDEIYNQNYPPFASRKKVTVAKTSEDTIVQVAE